MRSREVGLQHPGHNVSRRDMERLARYGADCPNRIREQLQLVSGQSPQMQLERNTRCRIDLAKSLAPALNEIEHHHVQLMVARYRDGHDVGVVFKVVRAMRHMAARHRGRDREDGNVSEEQPGISNSTRRVRAHLRRISAQAFRHKSDPYCDRIGRWRITLAVGASRWPLVHRDP
jgi:hypothetical protein